MTLTIAHHLNVLIEILKLFQAAAVMLKVHSSITLEVIAMDWPVLRMKTPGYCLAQYARNKTFSNTNGKLYMKFCVHVCVMHINLLLNSLYFKFVIYH